MTIIHKVYNVDTAAVAAKTMMVDDDGEVFEATISIDAFASFMLVDDVKVTISDLIEVILLSPAAVTIMTDAIRKSVSVDARVDASDQAVEKILKRVKKEEVSRPQEFQDLT
jgi:hypothetical protein